MSGFLHIRNLSEQDMTTFFTGEIMTSSHEFFTNPYGVESKIDIQHWVFERLVQISF
jgi:Vacuolar import and degradation protein